MSQHMRARPRDREQGPPKPLTDEEAERIVQGDAKLLVAKAQSIAQQLRDEASRTQIRRLYGEVKRIEMMWTGTDQGDASHRLLLLKPRLAYQVARNRRLGQLRDALEPVIDCVGTDRPRFQRFLEFFEAIVAYAR